MRLTAEGCRARQRRLLEVLAAEGLDGAIVSRREHVYYLTGFLHGRYHAAAALIRADGRVCLVGAGGLDGAAADEVLEYEPGYLATMHSRQAEAVAERLAPRVPPGGRLGADLGGGIACIASLAGGQPVDLSGRIVALRQHKLSDEVDAIRATIAVSEVMYAAAKEAVHPGADELEVFAHVRAAATEAAGEDLEHFGNDFRANAAGGPPRRRRMEAGELYILDAGPSLHGYFADNCRTFAVGRAPTEAQMRAWRYIDGLFPRLEAAVRPGLAAAELYALAHEYLSQEGYGGLVHHLGHGMGLAPHEAPQLNPHYQAVFAEGDVFTLEPGLYADELRAGIRLEENYLLTASGPVKLTTFPRSLV